MPRYRVLIESTQPRRAFIEVTACDRDEAVRRAYALADGRPKDHHWHLHVGGEMRTLEVAELPDEERV